MPSALTLWTVAYLLGVLVGDALSICEATARLLLLGGLAGLLIGGGLSWRRRWPAFGLALLALAAALGCFAQGRRPVAFQDGLIESALADSPADPAAEPPGSSSPASADETAARGRAQWRLDGRVVSAPTSMPGGLQFRLAIDELAPLWPAAVPAASASSLPARSLTPPLVVLVAVRGSLPEPLWPGDRVRVGASLRPLRSHRNPGAAERRRHFASLGVQAMVSVAATDLLRWDRPVRYAAASIGDRYNQSELATLRWIAVARAQLLLVIATRLGPGAGRPLVSGQQGLVTALLLGERGPLWATDQLRSASGQRPIEATFRAAGIFHILSVSGLHLAVASWVSFHGLAWLLLRISWLAQRWVVRRFAALLAMPIVLLYTLLTGAELPTVRAAAGALVWLLAVACGRRSRLVEALAITLLLLTHPALASTPALTLYEPSLQLSLAATLAIAYLRPLSWVLAWLGLPLARRLRPALLSAGLGLLRQLVDAALAATLMTVPICAYYFFEVQPAGVLGNLLAVPVGELVVLPVGLLGTLLGVWAPAVGGPLLDLAASASAVMLASASWLAALGYSWTVPPPSSWQVALWAVGLCAWAGRRGWLAIGLLGLALVSYLLLALTPVSQLVTTFLDVGQGDAAVIELPLGQVVVVDAGPALPDGRDLGALVVAPFLRWRGHRSIELLIASHRHPDHIGGLTTLIEQFPVARLWLPPGALLGAETSAEAARLAVAWQQVVAVAQRRGVQIESPATVQIGGASLEVLSPCQGSVVGGCRLSPQPDWGENDNSLVLRLRFAGRTLLLPGDLELAGELALLDRQDLADSLVADVLKAPHHCSRTSSSESLIAAVAPRWAVCSVGQQNRFGFPHPDVVARYRVANSTLLRTDRQGAVTVIIAPDGQLRVQTVE